MTLQDILSLCADGRLDLDTLRTANLKPGELSALLYQALRQGDAKHAEMALQEGAEIHLGNGRQVKQRPWLVLLTSKALAESSRTHLLKLMLERGIDLSYQGPVQGFDALSLAAYYGRGECVDMLLQHTEPSQSANALLYAVDDIDLTFRDASGRSPLHLIAASRYWRHKGVAPALLAAAKLEKQGADIDAGPTLASKGGGKMGPTPLWWCVAWSENTALCKWLLAKGASTQGLLSTAVLKAPVDMLDALLAAGADINEVSPRGRTPLLDALTFKAPERAEYLVSNGADATICTENGYSPLHVAVLAKLGRHTVQVLLDAGAPPALEDPKGNTAAQLAESLGQADVTQLLGAHR